MEFTKVSFSVTVSMAPKLYGFPNTTSTARILACLHEKGVAFELVPVNLIAGDHKHHSFLAKNPFGQIPVLEDGDLTLFESRAINAYLSHKYKDIGTDLLRHRNIKEAGLVGVWVEVEAQQFNPPISAIVAQLLIVPLYGKSADLALVEAEAEKLGKVLDVYEARLGSSKYLAGDFYSMADLSHLPCIHYLMKTTWASLITSRSHVKAWWKDISSRPSFKIVAEKMTLG